MKRLFAALALTNTVLAFAAAPVTKLTTLHSFVTTDGSHPSGRLVEGEDGVFFGVTADGGARNGGTVYKITASGVLTTLFDFAQFPNALDGEQPIGGLVRGADGDFYGVTVSGGDGFSFDGEIFRITATGTLTVLHSFAGTDGRNPSELMLASDGNFYGMTSDGGAAGGGTIYRMTPAGALNTLHDFPNDATEVGGGLSQLVEGPGMVLYGTAQTGGYTVPDIEGTFFSVSTTGTFNVLHRFLLYPQRPNGVVLGPDGALYGSTFNGQGFKLTTGGAITTLHELLGCSCGTPLGGTPVGNFLWRDDGNFYGVTTNGGVNHWGSIYSMSPTGALEPLHSFNGTDEGMHPSTTLIEGRDGRLYGTTFGFNTAGTVYKLAFLPAAPAGLSAAPGNPGEVALNWGGTRSANTYNVYRGTVSGGLAAQHGCRGESTTHRTPELTISSPSRQSTRPASGASRPKQARCR